MSERFRHQGWNKLDIIICHGPWWSDPWGNIQLLWRFCFSFKNTFLVNLTGKWFLVCSIQYPGYTRVFPTLVVVCISWQGASANRLGAQFGIYFWVYWDLVFLDTCWVPWINRDQGVRVLSTSRILDKSRNTLKMLKMSRIVQKFWTPFDS